MFDKYISKKVRVLVATGSGAGISNGDVTLGTVFNPMITVVGVLNEVGNDFIEINNSRMMYYSGTANSFVSPLSDRKAYGPDVMENEFTLLSLDKVIAISLIRENNETHS